MTHSYVWRTNVPFSKKTRRTARKMRLFRMCDMTHSHVCRDALVYVTCLICTCAAAAARKAEEDKSRQTMELDAAANRAIEWQRQVDESYVK